MFATRFTVAVTDSVRHFACVSSTFSFTILLLSVFFFVVVVAEPRHLLCHRCPIQPFHLLYTIEFIFAPCQSFLRICAHTIVAVVQSNFIIAFGTKIRELFHVFSSASTVHRKVIRHHESALQFICNTLRLNFCATHGHQHKKNYAAYLKNVFFISVQSQCDRCSLDGLPNRNSTSR